MPYKSKEAEREYHARYHAEHPANLEKARAATAKWRARAVNREKDRVAAARYRAAYPEKRRAYHVSNRVKIAERSLNRRHADPVYRLVLGLRSRLNRALRGKLKAAPTLELLGMDLHEFQIYIQGQFRDGMTWENRGLVWHLDHVKPCAKFNLADPEQQKICFQWDNLQPLFAKENLRKGAK